MSTSNIDCAEASLEQKPVSLDLVNLDKHTKSNPVIVIQRDSSAGNAKISNDHIDNINHYNGLQLTKTTSNGSVFEQELFNRLPEFQFQHSEHSRGTIDEHNKGLTIQPLRMMNFDSRTGSQNSAQTNESRAFLDNKEGPSFISPSLPLDSIKLLDNKESAELDKKNKKYISSQENTPRKTATKNQHYNSTRYNKFEDHITEDEDRDGAIPPHKATNLQFEDKVSLEVNNELPKNSETHGEPIQIYLNENFFSVNDIQDEQPPAASNQIPIISPLALNQEVVIPVNSPLANTFVGNPALGVYNQPCLRQEARLLIFRSCAFFFTVLLTSAYLLLVFNFGYPMDTICLIFNVCLLYFGVESIFRMVCRDREEWRVREDYFTLLDCVCANVFLLCIQFNFQSSVAVTGLIGGLFAINLILYLMFTKAEFSTKLATVMFRLLYGAQSAMIAGKLAGLYDWDWKFVLCPAWVYIGICVPFLIAFGLIFLLMVVFAALRLPMYNTLPVGIQLLGLSWYFFYYGIGVSGFFVLNELTNIYDLLPQEFISINKALTLSCALSIALLLLSAVKFSSLRDFLQIFNAPNDLDEEAEADGSPKRRQEIQFEVEKKESYFVMISPTYFSPLNTKFAAKNVDKIKKLKRMLVNFRFLQQKNGQEENRSLINQDESINIKVLKEYQHDLEEKLSHMPALKSPQPAKKGPRIAKTRTHVIKLNHEKVDQINSKKDIRDDESASKPHLSEGDVENMKRFDDFEERIKKESKKEEENICYICYEKVPDAVLMTCGHGGICYDCAGALVKKSGQCMECRGDVTQIIKVDPNPRLHDIVRGVEVSKVNKVQKAPVQ